MRERNVQRAPSDSSGIRKRQHRRPFSAIGVCCAIMTTTSVSGFQLGSPAVPSSLRYFRSSHSSKLFFCASNLDIDQEHSTEPGDASFDEPRPDPTAYRSTENLNADVRHMCRQGRVKDSLDLLQQVENLMVQADSSVDSVITKPDQATYVSMMNGLSEDPIDGAEQAEALLRHMTSLSIEYPCCIPRTPAYSAVILAWSRSTRKESATKADALLTELWSLYNATHDKAYLPTRAAYVSTITAWARSGRKRKAAVRAEELLEEMEAHRAQHPRLGPNTACINAVLNAWSKSGDRGAAERCEAILQRMTSLALNGRTEVHPDTVSFNTAIDTIAQSGHRDAPRRAEAMLKQMDQLSRGNESSTFPCSPDTLSFNVVINSWAKSRDSAAARRAGAILRHMERQFEAGATHVQPDATTYNSVIHAWSRSKEEDAPLRAANVMKRMERAVEKGNRRARPDANSFNSMINVLAKSKHPEAGRRAMKILNVMKDIHARDSTRTSGPDIFTYTSTMDCLAKAGTSESAEEAAALLSEVEAEYERTGDARLRPNVRTYTSTINAIARSRQGPDRAKAILDRLEAMSKSAGADTRPDVVCYNAAINAFGWSSDKGKAIKTYELYKRMLAQYKLGNVGAKPDIVTCNSILNACAFDSAENEAERAQIMNIAVQTLEAFQSQAPTYGWPNHHTYGNMLLAISRQMPMSEKRLELAEATFYQCCQAGHVSPLVISQLRNAVDAERLGAILGSALTSNSKDSFRYDMDKLPREWRKYARHPNDRFRKRRGSSPRKSSSTKNKVGSSAS